MFFAYKTYSNFSSNWVLVLYQNSFQQNSLPRIHSSLLQLIATYSFINLDTVAPLARFWPKETCVFLCALNLFVRNHVYNTFACAQVNSMGQLRAGNVNSLFNERYIICWGDLHRSKSTLGGGGGGGGRTASSSL